MNEFAKEWSMKFQELFKWPGLWDELSKSSISLKEGSGSISDKPSHLKMLLIVPSLPKVFNVVFVFWLFLFRRRFYHKERNMDSPAKEQLALRMGMKLFDVNSIRLGQILAPVLVKDD